MKKVIILITIIIPIVLGISSCDIHNAVKSSLDLAEQVMDENPKEALDTLLTISNKDLETQDLQARHALLLSIALDKNYIDLQSDSIISPAVAYYQYRGTPEEKAKTYYYRGRIEMNAGNHDQAMPFFLKAGEYADKTDDDTLKGLIYAAKSYLYLKSYAFDRSFENEYMAAESFLDNNDTTRYVRSLFNCLHIANRSQDTIKIQQAISRIDIINEIITQKQHAAIYSSKLFHSLLTGSCIQETLDTYMTNVEDSSLLDWHIIAYAYLTLGEPIKSDEALQRCTVNRMSDPMTYWVKANIDDRMGRKDEALDAYRTYLDLTDTQDRKIYASELKYLEDRHIAELALIKKRITNIILIFASIVLTVIIILLIVMYRQSQYLRIYEKEKAIQEKELLEKTQKELCIEKQIIEQALAAAESEIADLKRIKKNTVLSKNVRQQVDERLSVLNKFIEATISSNARSEAEERLKKLTEDRDYFLNSTKMSFMIAHTRFIEYLKKARLSDREVEYCCLFAIGFNGSQIASYMGFQNRHSFYNVCLSI